MQGTDRRLVNPPTTLAAFDAEQAAKAQAAEENRHERFAVWLKGDQSYTCAVEAEASANSGLALIWLWQNVGDKGDNQRATVLDYLRVSAADLRTFAEGLTVLADRIDAANRYAQEVDTDRREDIASGTTTH